MNLQTLRDRVNWSTRALAEHSKLGRRTVQRMEQGEFGTVTLETLDRLARGLGVRPGSLVGTRPIARRASDRIVEDVLADNLLRLRSRKGWTQEALAERASVSRPMIARIETKATKPDLRTLQRLAETLGVTLEKLLTEPRGRRPAR